MCSRASIALIVLCTFCRLRALQVKTRYQNSKMMPSPCAGVTLAPHHQEAATPTIFSGHEYLVRA